MNRNFSIKTKEMREMAEMRGELKGAGELDGIGKPGAAGVVLSW